MSLDLVSSGLISQRMAQSLVGLGGAYGGEARGLLKLGEVVDNLPELRCNVRVVVSCPDIKLIPPKLIDAWGSLPANVQQRWLADAAALPVFTGDVSTVYTVPLKRAVISVTPQPWSRLGVGEWCEGELNISGTVDNEVVLENLDHPAKVKSKMENTTGFTRIEVVSTPKLSNPADYPHKCTHCSSPSYNPFMGKSRCSNSHCELFERR